MKEVSLIKANVQPKKKKKASQKTKRLKSSIPKKQKHVQYDDKNTKFGVWIKNVRLLDYIQI